jgi:hypothetical protein
MVGEMMVGVVMDWSLRLRSGLGGVSGMRRCGEAVRAEVLNTG